ncbi:hypothetical protein, partial [Serratia nevei]|uniref:hypothetical protein n=1 Tax=Serratia nevei TaxID=2703794 RepID=UPI002AA0C391
SGRFSFHEPSHRQLSESLVSQAEDLIAASFFTDNLTIIRISYSTLFHKHTHSFFTDLSRLIYKGITSLADEISNSTVSVELMFKHTAKS